MFEFFFNGAQMPDGRPVTLSASSFFRRNEGIKAQESKVAERKSRQDASLTHFVKTSNASNFAQAIQFADVGLQIKISQVAKRASRHLQRQFVWCQAMNRMQILHGGFDAFDVFHAKGTANVEIKRGQCGSMVNNTDSADDNEVEATVFESDKQG
ncbi:MAG TPA: hypothetical protein VH595_20300 [Verrucomicrobiae bacterium]|nr:hypothetical protein [Verrucomicrobiae bacterium]